MFNELMVSDGQFPLSTEDSDSDEESEPQEETPSRESVLEKYEMAGKVVNEAIKHVLLTCKNGAYVEDICKYGDKFIEEWAKKYSKKGQTHGIAFPTCLSVNNCINHCSPLGKEYDDSLQIHNGDIIKLDLGAHIDGYCSVGAFTTVVGGKASKPVTGKKADVVIGAWKAAQVAIRLMQPGNTNYEVTEAINKVAAEYNCKPVSGMLIHQLKRNEIEGKKTIVLNPDDDMRREQNTITFGMNEVYGLDVIFSTGEGRYREMDARTNVYKVHADTTYNLKLKTSRQFFSEVDKKFGSMAFNLRSCNDVKKARLGVVECVKHGLVDAFTVLREKEGETVAQFKFTVALLEDGITLLNSLPYNPHYFETSQKIKDPELLEILSRSISQTELKMAREQQERDAWEEVARALSAAAM